MKNGSHLASNALDRVLQGAFAQHKIRSVAGPSRLTSRSSGRRKLRGSLRMASPLLRNPPLRIRRS